MTAETAPQRISLAEAVKLAHGKPDKGFTRNDLIVYGGWLNSGWSWSRDIGIPLERAVENASRLSEDIRIVGKPKLNGSAGAKKVVKKKSGNWSLFSGSLFSRRPKRPAKN